MQYNLKIDIQNTCTCKLHVTIVMLHVSISMLHADMNKLHMIYLACWGKGGGAEICLNGNRTPYIFVVFIVTCFIDLYIFPKCLFLSFVQYFSLIITCIVHTCFQDFQNISLSISFRLNFQESPFLTKNMFMFHASDMHTITYVIYIGNIQSYNYMYCASVQSIRITIYASRKR